MRLSIVVISLQRSSAVHQMRVSIPSFVFIILVAIAVLIGIEGCAVNMSVSGRNVSFLYKNLQKELEVGFKVMNLEKRTVIYLKIPNESLGKSILDDGSERASYSVRYRLFTSYSAPSPIDSGNMVRKEIVPIGDITLDTISLRGLEDRSYVVECQFRDLNSSKQFLAFVDIHREQKFNDQTVIFGSSDQGMLYSPFLTKADSLKISCAEDYDGLIVRYYNRDFPMASPPFAAISPKPFDFTPDERGVIRKSGEGEWKMNVAKKGFYQLTNDSTKRNGATVFYFGQYFPEAKTVMDLAIPLRYVTTNEEYREVMEGGAIKKNVDQYWLKVGGNAERARELISAFYGRVQYANRFFTSYVEGFKTDRGMCYIVYGPPDVVYRSTSSETWIYGEEGRYNSLSLTFTKVVNPFTFNDYRLNRSSSLKSSWYRAVEFWRQGRVLKYQ